MRCGDSAFFAVSARCFRAECAEIPRAASAKLHKMQFLCIAKRVTVNNVNSNHLTLLLLLILHIAIYPRIHCKNNECRGFI